MIGQASGAVTALKASDGKTVSDVGFKAGGPIFAPISILYPDASSHPYLIFMSFDGLLYIYDTKNNCADVIDLGEASYSPILIEDVDGDGFLELVISTMNGNIYGFGTSVKYHPLKTQRRWPINNSLFVNRYQARGIFASIQSRKPKDITGRNFAIQVNI